ncbi:hypothetical protein [Paenibacillus sp. L3-i20]|uniref:hypothetical protein n=1 Tax=Paenibacillus sp. L3-i20 TaxID=2905833 RepID=UPI001EDE3944|nr:hypothetical protein [Paenibacillus sp. L3-i20]GKU79982.1 hypothetical protein L3i20_v243790 [Paenibacillus sp. L3-i20]
MLNKKFILSFGLTFIYVIVFYFGAYGLMLIDIIDDGVFTYNHVFVGFYQWVYLLPFIMYLKKKNRSYKGYLIGGICVSCLNIALFVWIIVDPSTFF